MKVDQIMDVKVLKLLFGDDKDKSSFKIIAIENLNVGVSNTAVLEPTEPLKLLEGPNDDVNKEIEVSLNLIKRLPSPKTTNLSKLLVHCLHAKGVSVGDLAKYFGISKKSVYTYCNSGRIIYNMLNATNPNYEGEQ